MNPLFKGAMGETVVKLNLIEAGYVVSQPELATTYDLIVETENGDLLKIQVKSSVPNSDGILKFDIRRSHSAGRVYKKNDFDILAVVNLTTKEVAYVPYNEIDTRRQLSFETNATRSKRGCRRHAFLFEKYQNFDWLKLQNYETSCLD
ncbi:MAG: group I intron-associated PD-(D/E)XK endonuclease [Ectobacillus sp.]